MFFNSSIVIHDRTIKYRNEFVVNQNGRSVAAYKSCDNGHRLFCIVFHAWSRNNFTQNKKKLFFVKFVFYVMFDRNDLANLSLCTQIPLTYEKLTLTVFNCCYTCRNCYTKIYFFFNLFFLNFIFSYYSFDTVGRILR